MRKVAVVVVVAVALTTGVVLGAALLRPSGPELGAFHGAKLGMTADAVRAKFAPPAPGAWQSSAGSAPGEGTLAWNATQDAEGARFEFHSGMLVAVRARVAPGDPDAARPAREASPAVVRAREPGEAGLVNVTILARDCPTHAAEAARLAGGR